jgi:hypothetical protein
VHGPSDPVTTLLLDEVRAVRGGVQIDVVRVDVEAVQREAAAGTDRPGDRDLSQAVRQYPQSRDEGRESTRSIYYAEPDPKRSQVPAWYRPA